MSQPKITITERDGAIGVLPAGEKVLALVGASSSGPVNTPATYARSRDIVSTFGAGPLVEAAAYAIERYKRPVMVCRTGDTVSGAYGTVDVSGVDGTSVITAHAATEPNDDYDVVILFVTGGTRGTAGITYRYSLDGGANYSPTLALGTGTSILISEASVELDLAAGTIVAGDVVAVRTTAPQWNTAELTSAIAALDVSAVEWELLEVVGAVDANAFDALETAFAGMLAAGRPRGWVGGARVPNASETEAAYLSALSGIFGSKSSTFGALCAGAVRLVSGVSGRNYRRPLAHVYAPLEATVSEEVNTAHPIPAHKIDASIRDSNGNPLEHDESVNPGLDDARFVVARTIDGKQGTWINRPRLFSASGSDFRLLAHRRVMNLAHRAIRSYFLERLNSEIRVDKRTGFILEADAVEIEAGANSALRDALLGKPKASDVSFTLGRADNILATSEITGDLSIVPLAYMEQISISQGFRNPARSVRAV